MAVAALERSFIEICGFERETLHRFREVTVDQGKPPHTLRVFYFSLSHTQKSSLPAGERRAAERRKLAPC